MAAPKRTFRHLIGPALLLGVATAGSVAFAPTDAYAVDNGVDSIVSLEEAQSEGNYTGWARSADQSQMYRFENGVMSKGVEYQDPDTGYWYYLRDDGTMVYDDEFWIADHNKWVRYDEQGHMVHGVFAEERGTYYFDEWTGEMLHGEAQLSLEKDGDGDYGTGWFYFDTWTGIMAIDEDVYLSNDSGGKWVRYDTDGTMVHGEDNRVSKADGKSHWWYFDTMTGEMLKGLTTIKTSGGTEKTVLYDETFGWMLYGTQEVNGVKLKFDEMTGALISTSNANEIVSIALSKLGAPYKHAGLGPDAFSCDGFTAWVYDQAGVKVYESRVDSSFNGQSKYIKAHGGMVYSIDELEPGDVLFFGSSWDSLRHAAIYLGVEDGTPKMIHAAGHYVNGVRVGVTVGPLDKDFLGGGHPRY